MRMQKSAMFVKKNFKYLKDKKYSKVRDHCHYTGEYRGAANTICNLKYSVPRAYSRYSRVHFPKKGQSSVCNSNQIIGMKSVSL